MMEKPPKWYDSFINLVESCWDHHGPCRHLCSKVERDHETGRYHIVIAPVFQEVLGGEDDGKKVWTGFIFQSDKFYKADGVYIEHFAASSCCAECSPTPRLLFFGKYKGHPFFLQLLLEPPADGALVEVIDTINKKILDKPQTEE
jgi:hypothetical protein